MSERQAKLRALGDIRKEYQFTLLSDGTGVGCGIEGGYVSMINLYGDEKDYERMNKQIIKKMDKAYENSYKLLMGETTYEELAKGGKFLLPKNHEDPLVTLGYFIDIEDYEKCSKIRNKMKENERT